MKCVRTFVNHFTSKSLIMSESMTFLEISEANFSFVVPHFNKFENFISLPVYVRQLPWSVMLEFNYKENSDNSSLGVFVLCNYDKNNSWSCVADVELKLLSHKSSRAPHTKKFNHCFDKNEKKKGFDQFIEWSELICPRNGYVNNNEIVIEVLMKCSEPKGVAWNSRKHTGFIGLENKIENSFINSLTQILYCLDQFSTSIIDLTIDDVRNRQRNRKQNLIVSIQQVFDQLESSKTPVSIDQLIKSIGYRHCHTYDTVKFFNFLRKTIEKESLTKQVSEIFTGKMSTYSTHSKKFEVTKFRNFYSMCFKICDEMNIYKSFDNYFATNPSQCSENLDSSTFHDSSRIEVSTPSRWFYSFLTRTNPLHNGIQTSVTMEKRIEIAKLPTVLVLHLNRQVVHVDSANMDQLPFKFEFCRKLNLRKYVRKSVDSSTNYNLHAVLVRYNCGAFSAFVNPQPNENYWLKFNNDIVTHCSETEVIEENFSYVQMLIYVHQSKKNQVKDENAVKFTCIICLESTKNTEQFSTICGHLFCGPCIKKEISLRQKCPVCKNRLSEKEPVQTEFSLGRIAKYAIQQEQSVIQPLPQDSPLEHFKK